MNDGHRVEETSMTLQAVAKHIEMWLIEKLIP
jgi:hypothetical protein